MRRCFIAGAGEYSGSYAPETGDYIIAADGGFSQLASRGIMPDLVIGDFDSLAEVPEHPNIMRFPKEKDDTDTMLAVVQGFAEGCKTFIIDGGLGGMLDHTWANLQVLAYIAKNHGRGYLLGNEMTVTLISGGHIAFESSAKGRISVFSFGDSAGGITLNGLKYQLENATLTNVFPLGISNEFIGTAANIEVKEGALIIMWTGGLRDLKKNNNML